MVVHFFLQGDYIIPKPQVFNEESFPASIFSISCAKKGGTSGTALNADIALLTIATIIDVALSRY